MDEKFQPMDTFERIITPQYYKRMQKNIEDLTGITDQDLKHGLPFPCVMEAFQAWCGNEFVFITWGSEDIDILKNNMRIHKLDVQWISKTYNLQVIFDAQIAKENRQCSLTKAIELLGEPAFQAHDALSDAQSTACICKYLDMIKGMEEYEYLENKFKWNALDYKISTRTYRKSDMYLVIGNL